MLAAGTAVAGTASRCRASPPSVELHVGDVGRSCPAVISAPDLGRASGESLVAVATGYRAPASGNALTAHFRLTPCSISACGCGLGGDA